MVKIEEYHRLLKYQRLFDCFSILGEGVLHTFYKDTVANGLYHHSLYLGKDGSLTEKVAKIGQVLWDRYYRDYTRQVNQVNSDTLELAEQRKKLACRRGEKRYWNAVYKAVKRMASDKRVRCYIETAVTSPLGAC